MTNYFFPKKPARFLVSRLALWSLVLLTLACTSSPPEGAYGGLGQPSDPAPFMAKIRRGTLPSGLRYYILENGKPENRAYLTLAVRAGSVLETEEERGLAHFVEHMAFNGTARFPEAELIEYIRSLGMRFGAHANAYTSFDETVYGIEVPTETGENGKKHIPPRALAVIDDWTRAITFDPKDVDEERPIILEEYRSRLGAGERVQRKLLPSLFRGSPYEQRLPIGLPEIIESVPAPALEQFYKRWYRADNMALILVGDFDGAALEASLPEHFSIPAPESPLDRPYFDFAPPERGNFEVEIITDPELSSTELHLYYKRKPEPLRQDLAAIRQGLIGRLVSRMLNIRFGETALDPASPYLYAGAGELRYGAASRYYVLEAQAKTGAARESLQALLREKEKMDRQGFTAGELDLAARSLLSDLEQMASEKDRRESEGYIQDLSAHFLQGRTLPGIEWELDAARRLLPGIGLKDIAREVRDYFAAGDLRVYIIAPESERQSLPAAPEVRKIAAAARREKLEPRKDTALGDELAGELLPAGAILKEERDEATGALRWELSNGARVILQETANRNNEIVLYALARGGTLAAGEEEDVSVGLAAELFNASGAGPYTYTELVKKLADKQVSLTFWASPYYRDLQGLSSVRDIKTLFELFYLKFTDPRLDPAAAAALVDQYRTSLTQEREDPDALFSREINRVLTSNHPRFKPLELEDLPRVNQEGMLGFLHLALNPADYTFVFTGNLDLELLRPLTERYLAAIPRRDLSLSGWTDPALERPGRGEHRVYKGQEERSQVYMAWFSPVPYSEEGSAAAQVLEEYLDIKLTQEIRETLGGVYSISPGASLGFIPREELSLMVYFLCDPRRAEELSAAAAAQVDRIAGGTIDGDTFAKAREALLKTLEDNLQKNLYIAQSFANSAVLYRTGLDRLYRRAELYRALKPEDLQNLAARLRDQGPARITLYPEGWKPAD